MSARFVIIDGYNLMHAAGLARARYGPGDLHRQRRRLLVRLASGMTAAERLRCTVAFDAIEAPAGLERTFRYGEMTVMFADPGHEADELIEELIATHSAARQLLVVSSDHRLQKAAKQRRADSIDSDLFLERLVARADPETPRTASTSPPAQYPSKSPATGLGNVDYWMGEFGEIDVEALSKMDDPDSQLGRDDPWQKNLDELQRRLENVRDLEDWLKHPPGTD